MILHVMELAKREEQKTPINAICPINLKSSIGCISETRPRRYQKICRGRRAPMSGTIKFYSNTKYFVYVILLMVRQNRRAYSFSSEGNDLISSSVENNLSGNLFVPEWHSVTCEWIAGVRQPLTGSNSPLSFFLNLEKSGGVIIGRR